MLRNYKFIIAYDGTRFFGWERQPGRDTIQGKLESVLTRLQGSPVEITGAGRTDAGVHARAMAANAQLDVDLSPEEIRDYMNRYLPDAIAVREVKEAAPRFHARYKALGKTYRYVCFDGPVKPVFDRGTGPRPRPCPRGNCSPETLPDPAQGWWVCRRCRQYDPRRKQ